MKTKKKRGPGRPKGITRSFSDGRISPQEAAARLGVCMRTFWRLLQLGKVTGIQMVPKGAWRINAESVEALLNPPLVPPEQQ